MRIATYHPRARVGDGGITNSVRRLSEAFARAGAQPVIVYDGRGVVERVDGVEWRPTPHVGRGRGRVPVRLRPAFEDVDLVVLNSAWSSANAVAGAVARRGGIPYVLAPRGAYDPLIVARHRFAKACWWRLAERRLLHGASAVHVFFASQRDDVDALGYEGRVLVAPNGVQVPAAPRWDGGSGGYVVYLGRFDPEHKGIDLLLEAVASLPPQDRPELRLHGPDWRGGKGQVTARIAELELDDHVSVREPVYGEAKWELLARSVGLVYPSRWEGFGNSLAEAAALGVPTAATPYPLARFLGERGACIVVAASPEALALGIQRLCAPDARQIGTVAAELVAAELTWDAVAEQWLDQLAPLVTSSRELG